MEQESAPRSLADRFRQARRRQFAGRRPPSTQAKAAELLDTAVNLLIWRGRGYFRVSVQVPGTFFQRWMVQ